MGWYDVFSWVYDPLISPIYRGPRKEAVELLQVEPTSRVLDLACGTGEDFPFLLDKIDGGEVLGVDVSEGMLARAERRFGGRRGLRLLCKDARLLTPADTGIIDRVIVVLGLSVIPDWEAVFEATWTALAPGGRYVILDVHAERWVPQSALVTVVAGADIKRRVWEPMQRVCEAFEHRILPGSPHIHGGHLHLAMGVKPL